MLLQDKQHSISSKQRGISSI